MRYRPHEHLIEPARASAGLGRLAAGVISFIAAFVLLSMIISALINTVAQSLLSPMMRPFWDQDLANASSPLAALVNLYFFLAMVFALAIALWLVHQRPLRGLVGPFALALRQAVRVIKATVPILLLTLVLPMPEGMEMRLNIAPGLWAALLPLTLVGLLIQTSAEELAFRGYLQSQLAARFSHPLIWIGLPSLLFGLLHYDPHIDSTSAGIVVLWATCFGAATADLTARSGTLGPAIALHFVNNSGAIALAAPEGNFDGLALFAFPFSIEEADKVLSLMPVEMLVLLCSWLAARLALRV
ncbi:CPBP family intramembrane metalloprotease [Roseovarius faecimaris]|uniref:CPBP family intramembrane metalloprotease n=1 Tax=Roseovarius faecimaris TaxID=2494550 RepID=A0A6I6IVB3_9RHOB|nr:type II CAAX endopeptidase family protein [Roseovarius faecimaris]QGX99591.1 CPBP family intramembrane metalloprotease [Roseovarius faecimaris]